MRNIKTRLRLVRNTALLFAAASGMTYLTACQETDLQPGNEWAEEGNVEVTTLPLTTGVNPTLARTYFNSHMTGTRAGAFDVPEHPGMPTTTPSTYDAVLDDGFKGNAWACTFALPADAKQADYNGLADLSGIAVYVPAGTYKSLPAEFNLNYVHEWASDDNVYWTKLVKVTNPIYYIDGEVTCGGFGQNGKLEIHILNGGSLTANSEFATSNIVYLYEGGKLLRSKTEKGGDNQIYLKNTVYSEANIGDDNSEIIMDGAKVYTFGKIHGKTVKACGATELYAGCAVTAVDEIYFTNSSNVNAGYVSAPTVKLDSGAKIQLREGGYLNATDTLQLLNIGTVLVTSEPDEVNEEGTVLSYCPAMVETKVLECNDIDLKGIFQNLDVKYTTQAGSNEGVFEFNEKTRVNEEVVYNVVKGEGCAPKMVVKPGDTGTTDPGTEDPGTTDPGTTTEPDPTPTLENIGSISPTDGHSHEISATCIATNGKDAYLSWHTQGGLFHGCIEYLTVDNGTVSLNAYLETNPAGAGVNNIDFNHVIYDNGKIFVAGDHQKKGGILGWIKCDNGGFVTGNATLNMRQLYKGEGGSGNCVIRNGKYLQVASIKGFETFTRSDFDVDSVKPKSVAALAAYDFKANASEGDTTKNTGKHIATDGKNVVMLTLINRDKTANTANASIKVYAANDAVYKKCDASYVISDAVVAPVDGKDVIAINDNDIWVCLGQGGVQHLKISGSTMEKVSEFKLTAMTKEELKALGMSTKEAAAAGANGLAVDNKYVYVAHGGAGLVVLNKEDLSYVTRSRHNGGNSANYVALHSDGYIYVAYGKSKVQVYAWKK